MIQLIYSSYFTDFIACLPIYGFSNGYFCKISMKNCKNVGSISFLSLVDKISWPMAYQLFNESVMNTRILHSSRPWTIYLIHALSHVLLVRTTPKWPQTIHNRWSSIYLPHTDNSQLSKALRRLTDIVQTVIYIFKYIPQRRTYHFTNVNKRNHSTSFSQALVRRLILSLEKSPALGSSIRMFL